MHLQKGPKITDPRREKLHLIARRLFNLLKQSDNPEADKQLAETMLLNADLLWIDPPQGLNLFRYCHQLIEENDFLYEVIDDVRSEPESWDLVESVEELIYHCIPSEGDRQL